MSSPLVAMESQEDRRKAFGRNASYGKQTDPHWALIKCTVHVQLTSLQGHSPPPKNIDHNTTCIYMYLL